MHTGTWRLVHADRYYPERDEHARPGQDKYPTAGRIPEEDGNQGEGQGAYHPREGDQAAQPTPLFERCDICEQAVVGSDRHVQKHASEGYGRHHEPEWWLERQARNA